jgi:hypothetical protein
LALTPLQLILFKFQRWCPQDHYKKKATCAISVAQPKVIPLPIPLLAPVIIVATTLPSTNFILIYHELAREFHPFQKPLCNAIYFVLVILLMA